MLLVFLFFVATLHYTRNQYFELSRYVAPLFVLTTSAFCYFMISARPRLFLGKVLVLLGTYSYSLYLLHLYLYDALEAVGALEYGRWTGPSA